MSLTQSRHVTQSRRSGLLLHVSCLPGEHGIGELGPSAERFVDFLSRAQQRVWQVLPLTPPVRGDSPYACYSAFAGNPLFISLPRLAEEGLLSADDLETTDHIPHESVDYAQARQRKESALRKSFEYFKTNARDEDRNDFESFKQQQQTWLGDYALFRALYDTRDAMWNTWDLGLVQRDTAAMRDARAHLSPQIERIEYGQYLFFRQWYQLKSYANQRNVQIMGDIPIFVAYESADTWAHQELFFLNEQRTPKVVAGVPPDYFSETGQVWASPIYNWSVLAEHNYDWWVHRIRHSLSMFDLIRLDHFRGFHSCWQIDAGAETAVDGSWLPGPGQPFFEVLRNEFGELPIVAEDLGLISDDIHQLRVDAGLPGMRVLQFGFSDDGAYHLPHNFDRDCVVYTGTHDNDTTVGWFRGETPAVQDRVRRYLGAEAAEVHWGLIRLALSSVANLAICPLQDVLGLGSEARMNTPGTSTGNWSWRFCESMLTTEHERRLRELTETYGRAE